MSFVHRSYEYGLLDTIIGKIEKQLYLMGEN